MSRRRHIDTGRPGARWLAGAGIAASTLTGVLPLWLASAPIHPRTARPKTARRTVLGGRPAAVGSYLSLRASYRLFPPAPDDLRRPGPLTGGAHRSDRPPSTTVPPAGTGAAPAPASTDPATAPVSAAATTAASPTGYGCTAALAWLRTHAAPGFSFECPGYALGHQAMTCYKVASVCPTTPVIVIADPCPAAYMNEASNSWVLIGARPGPFDPYGDCP